MRYTLKNTNEAARARDYLDQLIASGKTADIKKVSERRSLSQNSYLHLLLSAFGAHFGYTLAETKIIYKMMNQDLYVYVKPGKSFVFYRSSADLTKEQMTQSIEAFRQYSADNDYPLPTATDQGWLQELSNTIEAQEKYL